MLKRETAVCAVLLRLRFVLDQLRPDTERTMVGTPDDGLLVYPSPAARRR